MGSARAQVEQLLRDSQSELFAFLLGRLEDREDALDALQDVLLAVWRKREELGKLPFDEQRRYLYAAARNRAIDVVRSRLTAQHRLTRPLEEGNEPPGPAPQPLERVEQRVQKLNRLIARLDPDDRVLLHLYVVGGLNCNDIADRLGRPPGTIRSQLARLRQRLRGQMDGNQP